MINRAARRQQIDVPAHLESELQGDLITHSFELVLAGAPAGSARGGRASGRVRTMNRLATSILFSKGTRAHRFWAAADLSMMSLSSAWEGYVRATRGC